MSMSRLRPAFMSNEFPPRLGQPAVGGLACALVLAQGGVLPPLLSPWLTRIGTCGVGVVFGFFPARRAARLDPIDALRGE